ncbi:hypothetical protein L596_020035 [Steinernema carpocapsae]|uniref:Uncharacterized protein n=1 Tax=Steinernema carpocapsae TaxID=34508 RepID=A0A4U5MSC4_STECR|nr:hypothetical protein L596_020035 [Steinernema carpocapsae]
MDNSFDSSDSLVRVEYLEEGEILIEGLDFQADEAVLSLDQNNNVDQIEVDRVVLGHERSVGDRRALFHVLEDLGVEDDANNNNNDDLNNNPADPNNNQ